MINYSRAFSQSLMLIAFSVFLFACEKEQHTSQNEFKILRGACGSIQLKGNIGKHFNAALDSLETFRKPFINGGCPDNPCHDYYTEKDTLKIDYINESRTFVGIKFKDASNDLLIFSMSDVLDNLGNHYQIKWCPD